MLASVSTAPVPVLVMPFLRSSQSVFETLLATEFSAAAPESFAPAAPWTDLTSSVTLKGGIEALLSFHSPSETALRIFERMTGIEAESVDDCVLDSLGEMSNMIGGYGKRELEHLALLLGLPRVTVGLDADLVLPMWQQHIWLPLSTGLGACAIAVAWNEPE